MKSMVSYISPQLQYTLGKKTKQKDKDLNFIII